MTHKDDKIMLASSRRKSSVGTGYTKTYVVDQFFFFTKSYYLYSNDFLNNTNNTNYIYLTEPFERE